MRLLLLFCFCLLLVVSAQAQERVRNVRIYVVDSSQVEIRYDLINARPGDSVYVEMRSRVRGVLQLLPEFVRGDVGLEITAGANRRIIWDALANGYSLNEEVQAKILVRASVPLIASRPVLAQKPAVTTPKPESTPPNAMATEPASTTAPKAGFKRITQAKRSVFAADTVTPEPVRAAPRPEAVTPAPVVVAAPPQQQPASNVASTPVPQQPTSQTAAVVQSVEPTPQAAVVDSVIRRPKTRYAGPAWALLSAVAPGIGNIFVQTPKPKIGLRPLLTLGCYGLIAYGLSERKKAQDEYAIYEQQKNATAGEPYYQTANGHHQRYFMATRGAVIVAAADVILTFIKGLRNSQIQKEARRIDGVTLRPGIQAGQVTAVVRYAF